MANPRLVRFSITLNVSLLDLFFKIKNASVNRVFRRAKRGDEGEGEEEKANATVARNLSLGTATRISYDKHSEMINTRCQTCASRRLDQANSSNSGLIEYSTRSNLPKLDRFFKHYYRYSEIYNWYLLIKNLILCVLRHETFASWRFLDCYLLGRYIINGRVIELSPYCACYIASIRLLWIYAMTRRLPEFKMSCIEFLLDERGHQPYWSRASNSEASGCHMHHSALLEYRNPFHRMHRTDPFTADPFRLRPNRTREVWNVLGRTAIISDAVTAIIFTLLGTLLLWMGLPVVLTRRGVEYNYRHCLHWLAQEHARGPTSWLAARIGELFLDPSHRGAARTITATDKYVRPPIILDVFMPFTGFVNLSLFHVLRSTIDVFESAFLYLEIALLLKSACLMVILFSKDILHYCRSINRRLNQHILIRQTGSNIQVAGMNLSAETSDIQAQVADLLIMLDSYNRYISRQTACLLTNYFGYTALISSWIFTPGNESPKLEWYVIHCGTTLYVFFLLVYMSEVRASCRRMYRLVSVAMGLDENHKARKSLWLSLLQFYKPRPLYCFYMIGSIEITYMLGLKLLVWLLSALIVASSFFRVYNIK